MKIFCNVPLGKGGKWKLTRIKRNNEKRIVSQFKLWKQICLQKWPGHRIPKQKHTNKFGIIITV